MRQQSSMDKTWRFGLTWHGSFAQACTHFCARAHGHGRRAGQQHGSALHGFAGVAWQAPSWFAGGRDFGYEHSFCQSVPVCHCLPSPLPFSLSHVFITSLCSHKTGQAGATPLPTSLPISLLHTTTYLQLPISSSFSLSPYPPCLLSVPHSHLSLSHLFSPLYSSMVLPYPLLPLLSHLLSPPLW